MKVLYNTQTQEVSLYPRNDDEPVIGLSPEYLVLEKIGSDPPSPTAISSWEVNLEALEYCQVWTEPEPPPPAPDWLSFNLTMIPPTTESTFEVWLGQFKEPYRVALVAASSQGDTERVQAQYELLKNQIPPTAEQIAEWQGIADASHVPVSFEVG